MTTVSDSTQKLAIVPAEVSGSNKTESHSINFININRRGRRSDEYPMERIMPFPGRNNPIMDGGCMPPDRGFPEFPEFPVEQPKQPPYEQMIQVLTALVQQLMALVASLIAKLQPPAAEQTPATPPVAEPAPAPVETAPAPVETAPAPVETPATPTEGCGTAAPAPEETADKDPARLGHTGEFLWKPESEKDGKLAVLIPSKFTGKVKSVKIFDKNGKKVGTGEYSGTANGNREHFRFDKPGGKYPEQQRCGSSQCAPAHKPWVRSNKIET